MTNREQYVAGLRMLADLLEDNPEFDLPYEGDIAAMQVLITGWNHDDHKAALAEHVRTLLAAGAGAMEKTYTNTYFNVKTSLGGPHGLDFEVTARRDQVCERVVTGQRTVTKRVPDPELAAAVPVVEVEEVEDVVEWRCEPLLADDAPALTDEPGKVTKLTGPNSVSHPGPMGVSP